MGCQRRGVVCGDRQLSCERQMKAVGIARQSARPLSTRCCRSPTASRRSGSDRICPTAIDQARHTADPGTSLEPACIYRAAVPFLRLQPAVSGQHIGEQVWESLIEIRDARLALPAVLPKVRLWESANP